MILGPVFHAELLMNARRGRLYAVRFIYGLIILCQIYLSYQGNLWRFGDGRGMRIRDMAEFGRTLFTTFAILQAVVVVLLTPALVGGAIADERQRKTLHYLLASELSGLEIVASKLAARLLQVVVLVALGLPVVCLIGLFGGVDFELLLMSYAGTLSTTYFLGALSILVSVASRRPREAISLIYILGFGWLIVPTALLIWMPTWAEPWPTIAHWISPALRWVAVSSPAYLMTPMARGVRGGMATVAFEAIGTQLAYGTILVAFAALRLRPSSRSEGGEGRGWFARRAAWARRKQRWFARPACGDEAMLWKEKYVSRTGGATKVTLVGLGAILIVLIGYSGFDFFVAAVDEFWREGYSSFGGARRDFNGYLRAVGTAIYGLWLLGVASGAASGLTSEREEDTWISLISTPLDGGEIIKAKLIGPVWALRPVAYLIVGLLAAGMAAGSIHPLGAVACLVELAAFSWFLTAIGTFFSLRSKNSTRAQASTMAVLIFLNGGYLFCCIPFRPDTSAILAGCTPALFAASLLSPEDLGFNRPRFSPEYYSGMVAATGLGLLFYTVAAAVLTTILYSTFDEIADRPDRFRRPFSLDKEGITFLKSDPGSTRPTDKLA